MKKTILALVAAGLLPLVCTAAEPTAAPPPPASASPPPSPSASPTPHPEPKTMYGDVARVLSAQPVYAKAPSERRECRLENTGYSTASPAADVPRCDESAERHERVVAYDVTYQYHGREFRILMPYDPGEQMAVNVDVRPPMPGPRPGAQNPRYRGPY